LRLTPRQRAEVFELYCTQWHDEPRDRVDVAQARLDEEYELVMERGGYADDAWKGVITYLVAHGWSVHAPDGTQITQQMVDRWFWNGPAPVDHDTDGDG
jgi:hypothetical protein